jgi:TonB-linked outer membrane protein, SusC/RagA family
MTTQGQRTNPLADIAASDIESIEILKDASATAIYGARAANGVVIITTKRGKYNSRPKVNLNSTVGWAWTPKLWNLVTGPEHATIINEAWINDGKSFATRPFRPVSEGGRGLPEEQKTYDRLNDVFRTGLLQSYSASVSGGTQNTKYYIGGDYTKQEATMRPVYFQREGGKINLDQKISKYVTLSVSNSISKTYRKQARIGDGPNGGMLQAALHTPTYLPKFNADGSYAKWAGFDNLDVLIKYTNMNSNSYRYIGNFKAQVDVLPNLHFTSSWGIDLNDYDEFQYWNSFTSLGAPTTAGAPGGSGSEANTKNIVWTNEQTLEFVPKLGNKQSLSVLVGNSLLDNRKTFLSASGNGFPNDAFELITSAATRTSDNDHTESGLASYFGRVNYDFAKKYFLTFSLRFDGSSKFGSKNKWGTFPSVGFAWQLKEEAFLKNVEWLNSLKLRGSFGIIGNQNGINNFASQGLWGGGYNYAGLPGIAPEQLANENLKWETTRQTDFGLNLNILNGILDLELDYYQKYTSGLLLQFPLPYKTGYTSIYRNDGEISNKGFEVTLTSLNINKKNIKWSTSINLAQNKNLIEKLSIPINQYTREWVRMEQGHPLYSFYLYKQLYVDPQTGNSVFEGQDASGNVPTSARQVMGNTWPKLYGGITNNFQYKNFDLSIFFNFNYGNDVFNLNRYFLESGGTRDDKRALHANQLKRWQKPGDITDVPRVTTIGNNYNLQQNSRFLEDGSFLRLSSLTLGYTLPENISRKINLNKVKVYVTGSNLWLLKKYTDPDPEINVAGENQNVQGLDLGTPPQPRTFQFGLNLTF